MDVRRLNFLRRALDWKRQTDHALVALQENNAALAAQIADAVARTNSLAEQHTVLAAQHRALIQRCTEVEARHSSLAGEHAALALDHQRLSAETADLFLMRAATLGAAGAALAGSRRHYLVKRGRDALLLAVADAAIDEDFGGGDIKTILADMTSGHIERLIVFPVPVENGQNALLGNDELLALFRSHTRLASALFARSERPRAASSAPSVTRAIARVTENPNMIDFIAAAHGAPPPFDRPEALPATIAAEPKRRSALFLHNNYYHFNCLSAALRKRGWDTMTVSVEPPDSPQQQFFHGQDINLHHPDPTVMRDRTREFFKTVPERFGALHFYGKGSASFFPELFETAVEFTKAPWDFMELRRHRMVIGYMPSGCLDGARQSDIRRISGDVCARCMWEHDPVVCSDARNAAWGRRVESLCDWIGIEGDWGVGERTGDRYVRQAVVTTLDPEMWRPKLDIPEDMRIEKSPGELVIYHGVGNDRIRREGARDIKGTGAVLAAVEKLREEGHAVRIVFATDIHSTRVRFLQAQADIVVDQLNYGRYGANARECLMLGLPVVGYLDARQDAPLPPARQIEECPIVQADIHSVQNVLRGLILDSRAREKAAKAGRKFAVKWHGAMACAERYEKVIDRVRAGLAPDSPDLYPSP